MGCSRVCSDSAESVTADVHVHHTWLVVVVARTRRERRDVESFCERGGDVMFSRTGRCAAWIEDVCGGACSRVAVARLSRVFDPCRHDPVRVSVSRFGVCVIIYPGTPRNECADGSGSEMPMDKRQ